MGLLLAAVANAQTIYHDASAFPFWAKQQNLPLPTMSVCRTLCRTSPQAIVGLRPQQCRTRRAFRSNSTNISAKWEVRNNMSMNHMTPTGIKGLDLYCARRQVDICR